MVIKRKVLFIALFTLLLLFYFSLPKPLFTSKYCTVVYDRQHQLLNARIAEDGQWRFSPGKNLPNNFEKCLLEFEDHYFYNHPGINLISLVKAFYRNISTNKKKIGGSTITMQLVRISRENPKRTYIEKCIELILALRLEIAFTKKEILLHYANNAPFGGNVVGLEAAAWRYFGRSSNQLSWSESAMLAVLPNAPSLIYPGKNHYSLLKKRNALLKKIYLKNIIDKNTYELALQESIPEKPHQLPQLAPHLLQRISIDNKEGNEFVTTLNKTIQTNAINLLNKHLEQHKSNQINNAAALIVDTYSGEILAYVGNSKSPSKLNQNDVDIITAPRSSGSLLKPILYALLLSEGKLTPSALVEDIPTQIGAYAPKNYNLTYDGLVPASEALTRSLNVPAVKMLQQYGTSPFLYQLKKLGFESFNKSATHYGLSIILGGGEVTAWDVASAFASMGRILENYNKYESHTDNNISKIHYFKQNRARNKIIKQYQVLSAGSIWHTFNAMNELARPEDYSKSNFFASTNKIAWKTGTSFGFRDAWAVGVNKKYTIVVWVGNADGEGRPGLTGINVAAPLMFSLFNSLPTSAWFTSPKGNLIQSKICNESGYLASSQCVNISEQDIPSCNYNKPICTFHKLVNLDSTERFQVNSKCYSVMHMQKKSYFIMNPIQEYFYRKKHLDYMGLPPYLEGCVDESQSTNFDLIYPRNGFKIYLPINESNIKNDLILNATCNNNTTTLFWYLDGDYLGETKRYHQMAIKPKLGKHKLIITNDKGKYLSNNFEIIDKKKQ
ncbi:MAG TPA: penicillin-binding protein 1C [Bacteroidia bacterium]|nr:penicillin-binding protein 1C [Bacteroidia bacterium]